MCLLVSRREYLPDNQHVNLLDNHHANLLHSLLVFRVGNLRCNLRGSHPLVLPVLPQSSLSLSRAASQRANRRDSRLHSRQPNLVLNHRGNRCLCLLVSLQPCHLVIRVDNQAVSHRPSLRGYHQVNQRDSPMEILPVSLQDNQVHNLASSRLGSLQVSLQGSPFLRQLRNQADTQHPSLLYSQVHSLPFSRRQIRRCSLLGSR